MNNQNKNYLIPAPHHLIWRWIVIGFLILATVIWYAPTINAWLGTEGFIAEAAPVIAKPATPIYVAPPSVAQPIAVQMPAGITYPINSASYYTGTPASIYPAYNPHTGMPSTYYNPVPPEQIGNPYSSYSYAPPTRFLVGL